MSMPTPLAPRFLAALVLLAPTIAACIVAEPKRSTPPRAVAADDDSVSALAEIIRIRGVDGNGIDIRPKRLVPLLVSYSGSPQASQVSPYETVEIELKNSSSAAELLTVRIPNAPDSFPVAAGQSLTVTYTYEKKASGPGRSLRYRVGGANYDARLNAGSNYGADSVLKAPSSRRLNRNGDVELVIDVHGLKTTITIQGIFQP